MNEKQKKLELTEKQQTSFAELGRLLLYIFLIFFILQLTNNINWSWWWVTVPLWGLFALFIGAIILYLIGLIIYLIISTLIFVPIKEAIQRRREEKIGLEIAE